MRLLWRLLPTFVLLLVTTTVLSLSVKGIYGNPDHGAFTDDTWREKGPFELSPERGRFALLYSLIEDKTQHFTLPVARFALPDLGYKDGHYVSLFAPAVSLLTAPGYLVGKMLGASQVGTFAVVAVFGIINTLLIAHTVVKIGGNKWAGVIAGLTFLFATPAYPYATTLYQHHISSFLILASIAILTRKLSWLGLATIWFLCALSIPVDYPNVIMMMPVGLYALTNMVSLTKENAKFVLSIGIRQIFTLLSMTIPIGIFLWFNLLTYGNPLQLAGTVRSVPAINEQGLPVTKEEVAMTNLTDLDLVIVGDERTAASYFETRDLVTGLTTLLVSPDRGVITYTPVILLGIIGAFILYKSKPELTAVLMATCLANLLLYAMWGDPWGGWAFGSRYLIPAYATLSLFVGAYLSKYRHHALALSVFLLLAGYSVYINTAGALGTAASPPKAEVLLLESRSHKRERYSYDRALEFLQTGKSKSFVWQTWLNGRISAWDYYRLIAGSITAVVGLLTITLYVQRDKHA